MSGQRAKCWLDREIEGEPVWVRVLCVLGVLAMTVVCCVIGAGVAFGATGHRGMTEQRYVPNGSAPAWVVDLVGEDAAHTLEPCPTEDSVNCWWDAQTMGNGQGRSFVVTADEQVIYRG